MPFFPSLSHYSLEDVGVGASTAAIALSSALGIRIRDFASFELNDGSEGELDSSLLPPPPEQNDWILIWGGACSLLISSDSNVAS